ENECAGFNLEFYLGDAYEIIANYTKAKEHYHADLLMKRKKYKGGHIETGQGINTGNHSAIVRSLRNLGNICVFLGQYEDALKYYQEALAMNKTLYGDNYPDMVNLLNDVGDMHRVLEQNEKALVLHRQALKIAIDMDDSLC